MSPLPFVLCFFSWASISVFSRVLNAISSVRSFQKRSESITALGVIGGNVINCLPLTMSTTAYSERLENGICVPSLEASYLRRNIPVQQLSKVWVITSSWQWCVFSALPGPSSAWFWVCDNCILHELHPLLLNIACANVQSRFIL